MLPKMGKLKKIAITLTGDNPVYFAGSNIEGNVIVILSEPKKITGISIVLFGQAYVHWTESRNTGQHTETVHYSDSETILSPVSIQLWGNGKDTRELTDGGFSFPFKYQLPANVHNAGCYPHLMKATQVTLGMNLLLQ